LINNLYYEVIGVISDKSKFHSSYVGIPIYYRSEIGKLGIKGGIQSKIFLLASLNYEATGEISDEPYDGKRNERYLLLSVFHLNYHSLFGSGWRQYRMQNHRIVDMYCPA